MSKYGAIIAEARKPETVEVESNTQEQTTGEPSDLKSTAQKTQMPESRNTKKPASNKTVKPANSKTSKQQNQFAIKTENHKTQIAQKVEDNSTVEREEEVNLSIKVALRRRRHWASQAKLKGETLTEIITVALLERYGEPE